MFWAILGYLVMLAGLLIFVHAAGTLGAAYDRAAARHYRRPTR